MSATLAPSILQQACVLVVFVVWIVEGCRWLHLGRRLLALRDCSARSLRIMQRREASDHWKQTAMRSLSVRTMGATLSLTSALLLLFAPLLVWALLKDPWGVLHTAISIPGLLGTSAFAGLYAWARGHHGR